MIVRDTPTPAPHLLPIGLGVSSGTPSPWELTRRLSPRAHVGVMVRDAYGRIEENSYPRTHLVGPVGPDAPWLVRLADESGSFRLLCFDFDGKDAGGVSADLMEQAVDDCDALSGVLSAAGVAHVVCQSSGTGGRHVWVGLTGCPSPTVGLLARAARANYSTLDHGMLLNARTGGARPPMSPHRDGSSSVVLRGSVDALLAPSTSTADLEAVTAVLDASRPAVRRSESGPSGPVDARYRARRPLSKSGLAHMGTVRGGSNPSWTGFMCLLSAAVAGWTLAEVAAEVPSAPGLEHYRTKNTSRGTRKPRNPQEAAARLERQWGKAVQYAALHAPLGADRAPQDLTELHGIVEATGALLRGFQVSPGRWGYSEKGVHQRTVLTCVAYLSLATGKRIVAASIRDVALMCGLGRTTVAHALTALAADGWLVRVLAADGGNAAEWQLAPRLFTVSDTVRSQPLHNPRPPADLFNLRQEYVTVLEAQVTDGRHDVFTRRGLGHLAGQLYALLPRHGVLTVEAAARVLGIGRRHMTEIVSRLRTHRLISPDKDGWIRARRDYRDRAAKITGAAGTLLLRGERYQVEREIWAWWQAELQQMTARPEKRSRRPYVSARTLQFAEQPGERQWPRYPRATNGLGDHREARYWADSGMLSPGSLWYSSVA